MATKASHFPDCTARHQYSLEVPELFRRYSEGEDRLRRDYASTYAYVISLANLMVASRTVYLSCTIGNAASQLTVDKS